MLFVVVVFRSYSFGHLESVKWLFLIVEMTFVISRFGFKQKETRSFLSILTRNDQKRPDRVRGRGGTMVKKWINGAPCICVSLKLVFYISKSLTIHFHDKNPDNNCMNFFTQGYSFCCAIKEIRVGWGPMRGGGW